MSQDLPENTGGTVVWDYHVIAVERDAHSSVIYDLTRYHLFHCSRPANPARDILWLAGQGLKMSLST